MKISEKQLREMVKKTITSLLKESEDDIEIADDWYGPDEFDDAEIEEPTDADIAMDDDIIDGETIDNSETNQSKKEKMANLMRSILAKQGYSGERLEREVEKRMEKDRPDLSTRRSDSWFDNADGEYNVGGIYDDGLYENVINESRKRMIKEGTIKTELIDQWFYIQDAMGAEQMNEAILKALSENNIVQLIEMFKRVYEIDLSDQLAESDLHRIIKGSVNKILNRHI